jgi:hypothetical protein
MTTPYVHPHITATIASQEVEVEGGDVTLAALNVPYGSAKVILPLTEDTQLDPLDPRVDTRVLVNATGQGAWAGDPPVWVPAAPRVFDMGLRERTVDHVARTVELSLATDEALLTDYATLTVNSGARAYEDSVRAVCNYVLATVGGNLTPSPGPLPDLNGSGWWGQNQGGSPVGTLTLGYRNPHTARVTLAGGNPTWFGLYVTGAPVTPGKTYTARAHIKASKSTTLRVGIEWYNATPSYISSGPTWTITGTEDMGTTPPAVAPAGAVWAYVTIRVNKAEPVNTWMESYFASVVEGEAPPPVLAPGGTGMPDAVVTAAFTAVNATINPSWEVDTNSAATAANSSGLTLSAMGNPPPVVGTKGLRVTSTAAGNSTWYAGGYLPSASAFKAIRVTPGVTYQYSLSIVASVGRSTYPWIAWKGEDGLVQIGPIIPGVAKTTSTSAWTRYEMLVTAPPGAAYVALGVQANANTLGQFHYMDAVSFVPTTELVPYWDGATPADSLYTYAWDDVAQASSSTRTAKVDRPPEMFVWQPGVSAWDFLVPITSSVGLRLFCDEVRVWRLVDPAVWTRPGFVTANVDNLSDATDTITREDPEVFATGVVVRYLWRDDTGATRTQVDVAGTPHRVVVIEYARAYPGPGAAAAILRRRDGTGRIQEVTGLADWTTSPGMDARITLPYAFEQSGRITGVEFALDDSGLMTLATRTLIDIPPGSWAAATATWNAVTGTWDTYTG